MATSGSYGLNGGGWNSTVGWSLSRQDIGGNYSVVDWWWDCHWAASHWCVSTQARLWVNGALVREDGYNGGRRRHGGRQGQGQVTIWHNSDGTKSFGANGEAAFYTNAINARGNGWWDLPRIPRNAVLLSAQDFSDEGNPTITYSNPAGHNLSVLRAAIYNHDSSVPLVDYRDLDKSGSSYTFNLTKAERNKIRAAMANASSMGVRFHLWSVIAGNDARPYIAKTVSIVNANPSFTAFTYADTNSATKAITGDDQYIIQGKSTLRATITTANKATSKKSATMQQYIGAVNGQTKTANYSANSTVNLDFGAIHSNTNVSLSIAAKDSRNNRTSVNKTVQITPYNAPTVIARGERRNNFDKETKIHIEGRVSPLRIGNANKNAVNATSGVRYRYREQGTSSWRGWANVASSMGANGVIGTTDFWLNLDNTKAYEFEVQIADRLATSTVNFVVGVGVPVMRIGLDGHVYNNEQPLMPSHVGQVIMSTTLNTAEKVAKVYGGTWVAWSQGRVPVGFAHGDADFGAVNKTGGAKTVTLTEAQMPKHSHRMPTRIFMGVDSNKTVAAVWDDGGKFNYYSNDRDYRTHLSGNNQPHSNLQPYLTCYIWRRTV